MLCLASSFTTQSRLICLASSTPACGSVSALGEDVFDTGAHGFAVEELHLQEADLHMDQLMDQGHLGGCDGVELFDEVCGDGEGLIVVGDEVIEVSQGIEAVFEGVGGGLELA